MQESILCQAPERVNHGSETFDKKCFPLNTDKKHDKISPEMAFRTVQDTKSKTFWDRQVNCTLLQKLVIYPGINNPQSNQGNQAVHPENFKSFVPQPKHYTKESTSQPELGQNTPEYHVYNRKY